MFNIGSHPASSRANPAPRVALFASALMFAAATTSPAAASNGTAEPEPPGFAVATMKLPPRGADGDFVTPNSDKTGAQAFWQLRIGLNVAAIGCRGAEEARLTSHYNRMIERHSPLIRSAETGVIAGLARSGGGNGIAARDKLSTRLFNYFAQPPMHEGFCAKATMIAEQVAGLSADAALDRAPALLAQLDQPFVDFYEDYARWQIAHAAWRALGSDGDQRRADAMRTQMAGGTKAPVSRDGQ
ncbi:MAG: hypothetical protein RLZZ58_1440 [Pseudomonadota bacterium]|jgi:hypothetical protein